MSKKIKICKVAQSLAFWGLSTYIKHISNCKKCKNLNYVQKNKQTTDNKS